MSCEEAVSPDRFEALVITGGRVHLLGSLGPVTVVRRFEATEAERGRALAAHTAVAFLLERCRAAETGGDRHDVVDIHRLIDMSGATHYWTIHSQTLRERILDAANRGDLLVVDGWSMMRSWSSGRYGVSSTGAASADSQEAALVRIAMGPREDFPFEGARYRLIRAKSWERGDGESWSRVPGEEAAALLRRMVTGGNVLDSRADLGRLTALLADTRSLRPQGGIFVLRRIERRVFVSGDSAPAITPSRLRAMQTPGHWVEFRFTDFGGRPLPGARYRLILPSGSDTKGMLDGEGRAREEEQPLGSATIELDLQAGRVVRFPEGEDSVRVALGDYLGVAGHLHGNSFGLHAEVFSKDQIQDAWFDPIDQRGAASRPFQSDANLRDVTDFIKARIPKPAGHPGSTFIYRDLPSEQKAMRFRKIALCLKSEWALRQTDFPDGGWAPAEKLMWWPEVVPAMNAALGADAGPKLPEDGVVWHYHPLGFMAWLNGLTWRSEWPKYRITDAAGTAVPAPTRPPRRR